jgi:hypothetical protein
MNERFKELLEQTDIPHFPILGSLAWVATDHDMKKFAELIVRECMTQIQEVREIKAGHAGPEYTQGFDDGMFVAISTIEEHFGVEE